VSNSTAVAREAVLYGSALPFVRYEYPVLKATHVTVTQNGRKTLFVALALSRISANASKRILLRFKPPPRPASLSVTTGTAVHGDSPEGTTCSIGSGS
jgi:hypothetical protein